MGREDFRPGFHFTPRRNWMNDPNGLVYFRGTWHVFYQYNPEGNQWGNMSWGHASSPDLFHWNELPVAIRYDETEAIYSGSVVVDHTNSSGFGSAGEAPLVAVYTSALSDGRQVQSLAYSLNEGLTWTKYTNNPVLDRNSTAFRDPKVLRYQDSEGNAFWVMVAVDATERQVLFYASANLIQWSYLSALGPIGAEEGLWECPDLFWLPFESGRSGGAWVLVVSLDPGPRNGGSSTRYLIGDFDGHTFTPNQSESLARLDWGRDLYAAVTFDNAPENRRVLMGWMNNWNYAAHVPTSPWRGTMSTPRELSLRNDGSHVMLAQRPVSEIREIESGPGGKLRPFDLGGRRPLTEASCYRLDIVFQPESASHFGVEVLVGDGETTAIEYDVAAQVLALDRTRSGAVDFDPSFSSRDEAPVELRDGSLRLTVIVDRTSVEVFAQDGIACLTDQIFATSGNRLITVTSTGGLTRISGCELVTYEVNDDESAGSMPSVAAL